MYEGVSGRRRCCERGGEVGETHSGQTPPPFMRRGDGRGWEDISQRLDGDAGQTSSELRSKARLVQSWMLSFQRPMGAPDVLGNPLCPPANERVEGPHWAARPGWNMPFDDWPTSNSRFTSLLQRLHTNWICTHPSCGLRLTRQHLHKPSL